MGKKMTWELENSRQLPGTLGGYRPGRDRTSNASMMACDVYEGFQRNEETTIVALDLEDDYTTLMCLLTELGIHIWIFRWLLKRTVALRYDS